MNEKEGREWPILKIANTYFKIVTNNDVGKREHHLHEMPKILSIIEKRLIWDKITEADCSQRYETKVECFTQSPEIWYILCILFLYSNLGRPFKSLKVSTTCLQCVSN